MNEKIKTGISKIAIIHPTFNYKGGAENLILWTLEEFNKRGIETTVFTRTIREDAPKYIKQKYVNISINPLIFRIEAKKLLKKIVDFDAVIIHNFPATILWGYVYKEAVKKNIKLPKSFWYCHEPSVRLYGHDDTTYKKAIKSLDPIARYTIGLDKFGVSCISKIFANSNRTAEQVKRVYGREALIIHPAIPKIDIVVNTDNCNTEERNYFIYVGRIEKPKNLDTAIKSFKIFLETTRDYDVRFLIAGKGSDIDRLIGIVHNLGLENNVEFLGYVSNEEKIKLLQKSYAMILPAIYEPFGLTVIEAFVCNTVAILSKNTGVSEVVSSCSMLTDVSDTCKLSESMLKVYIDRDYRDTLLSKSLKMLESGVLFIEHYVNSILEEMGNCF